MDQTTATLVIEQLDSKPIEFVGLMLDQCFYDHHRVEIVIDLKQMGENVFSSPLQKTSLINEKVIIDIEDSGGKVSPYTFSGRITDVQIELDKGDHGLMRIHAASPTIELERGKMMQTYSDTSLKQIIDEVSTDAHFNISNQPKYASGIKFSMQYKETDFQYLRRIAWMYGEKFAYLGEDLVFGEYNSPVTKVTYGFDLTEVRFGTRLIANTFQHYYHTVDFEKSPYEHPLSKPGTFAGEANAKASQLNLLRKPDMPVDVPVWDDDSLQKLTQMRKERNYTDMFHVTGETKVFRVRIGGLLEIDFHNKLKADDKPGTLRVIRVRHVFNEIGEYHCEFDAVPLEFDRIPCPGMEFPVASALPAKVIANEDPDGLGKIQVKFDFDKRDCEYWFPVMMPEAGGPQNRGYIFVPEVDDKVLVSFFDGNPEFPFIMGSMFHGKNGKGIGGGAGNHVKSMRDKSGSEVVLNTQDGSATIKDKNGSDSNIKLDGNKNITIEAGKTTSINIGEGQALLKLDNEGNISVTGTKNISLAVGGSLIEMTEKAISISGEKINIYGSKNHIKGNSTLNGGKVIIN